ncbi:hypothetical protein LEP1GSC076_2999 [Leptospira sp. Fiocruz LV4135]|nr:hypothetical protein LEP1GSC076_2999 [Leptospira sp. Fiocruz LV4135]
MVSWERFPQRRTDSDVLASQTRAFLSRNSRLENKNQDPDL